MYDTLFGQFRSNKTNPIMDNLFDNFLAKAPS